MKNAQLLQVFNISILQGILNLENESLFKKELNLIRKTEGRNVSNLSGYQSNNLDVNSPVFLPFIKHIEFHCNKLAFQLGINNNLKIENFWLNVNGYKDANMIHSHPGGIFSGVYYLQVPINSGVIVFKNPASVFLESYWPKNFIKNYNGATSPLWRIMPTNNQMLIFPSWLEHFVEPNMNETEERISIAFNVSNKR
jgi:uncharacterized protein (TIGR02466 family)